MPSSLRIWDGAGWAGYGQGRPLSAALIGDSTLFQGGSGEASMRAALPASFTKVFFYARIGKPIILLDDLGYNVTDNIAQARLAVGDEPDVWLINVGSNGHRDGDALNVSWINQVMNNATAKVIWMGISQITGYDAGASTEATRLHWNDIAKPTVLAHPHGVWADWHTHVKARPGGDTALWTDGVHMTPTGYAFKNAFIISQIRQVANA